MKKETIVGITDIIAEIMNINEETVPKWIAQGLVSLTPETLELAINEWQDPLMIAEYLNLENIIIKNLATRIILKPLWERVEFTLKDPWELYIQISRNQQKKKLLDTPRGRAWLSYVRERVYEYIFYYTWGRKCPLCGGEMVRRKTEVDLKVIGKLKQKLRKAPATIVHEDYVCNSCGNIIPTVPTGQPTEYVPSLA
jgi:hypothetical protein